MAARELVQLVATDTDTVNVAVPVSELARLTQRDSPDEARIGSTLGHYEVQEILGQGGGGTVYAATHRVLGRRVAIKVLRAEMLDFPGMVEQFVREARAANTIRHPNIIDIFEFGEVAPGHPYYVMELLNGRDLRQLLAVRGSFSPPEMLALLEPVLRAVMAAHAVNIVHRDIKASNILVVDTVGERKVKLVDFGIAKTLQGEVSERPTREALANAGTLLNMAPEQIRGARLDVRTDIYALGVLMFQMLTGQYPFFHEDPWLVSLMQLQAPAQPPSELAQISPNLDAVVLKCLEKDPVDRFSSVRELMSALRLAVHGRSPTDDLVAVPSVAVSFDLSQPLELSDDAIGDLSLVLDAIDDALTSRGFVFSLKTANAIVAIQVLAEVDDPQRAFRDERQALEALLTRLRDRPGRHVSGSAAIACGEVLCERTSHGIETRGGLCGRDQKRVGTF